MSWSNDRKEPKRIFEAVKPFNAKIATSGSLAIMNSIIVSFFKEYSVLDSIIQDGRPWRE